MAKFVYVFDKKTCDDLISKGCKILKSDTINNIYVFETSVLKYLKYNKSDFVSSNTLTF